MYIRTKEGKLSSHQSSLAHTGVTNPTENTKGRHTHKETKDGVSNTAMQNKVYRRRLPMAHVYSLAALPPSQRQSNLRAHGPAA